MRQGDKMNNESVNRWRKFSYSSADGTGRRVSIPSRNSWTNGGVLSDTADHFCWFSAWISLLLLRYQIHLPMAYRCFTGIPHIAYLFFKDRPNIPGGAFSEKLQTWSICWSLLRYNVYRYAGKWHFSDSTDNSSKEAGVPPDIQHTEKIWKFSTEQWCYSIYSSHCGLPGISKWLTCSVPDTILMNHGSSSWINRLIYIYKRFSVYSPPRLTSISI